MFGGLFGSIWHRIKWVAIFIMVIFGYLAITNPAGISGAANTIGALLGGIVSGFITIIKDVLNAAGVHIPHH